MMVKKYLLKYSDSFAHGRKLSWELMENDQEEDDLDLDCNSEIVELECQSGQFRVYHVNVEFGIIVNPLKIFNTEQEAENYCQYQYVLTTGGYPFINEKRDPLLTEIPSDMKVDFSESKYGCDFLLISELGIIDTHSMGPFDEW